MYRRRVFNIFLAFWLAIALVLNSICYPALAQNYQIDSKTSVPSYVGSDGTLYPDWNQITLADIPPIAEAGSFDIAQIADATGLSTEEFIAEIGYDPSRSWGANTPIKDIFMLGDFKDISNIDEWNMSAIAQATGADLGGLKLGDFGLLKDLSVEDLISAVPDLENLGLEEVEPLFDLAKAGLGVSKTLSLKDSSLGDLASSNFDFASLKMDSIDLSQYDFSSIEGLEDAQFGDFAGSDGAMASEIPYMEYVQMASYLLELVNFNFIGKIDVVYGEKEARRVNTVSGSYQEGFNVPCEEDSCAYIELTDAIDFGLKFAPLHGKQWIAGKSQAVEGGFGPLKYANITPEPGKEPTGRNVFGEFFKVVLTNTIESEGKAEFGLYFRFCMYIFGYKTCTPYAYGPVPWFPFHETDLIPLGFGGTTSGGGSSSPGSTGSSSSGSGSNEENGEQEEQTDGTLCGQASNGFDYDAMASAFERIESQGDGKYQAIGVYDCSGSLCGRGLGRYQYMTFHPEIQQYILSKPGGKEFLARVNTDNDSASYRRSLAAELPKYFTVEEQNQHFKKNQADNLNTVQKQIDPTTGKPFTGRRLIERMGQVHFGGTARHNIDSKQTDSLGVKSIYQYGKEFASHYEEILASSGKQDCSKVTKEGKEGDGKTTGKPTHPIPSGATITSGYGWRVRPLSGKTQMHKGIDLGAPMGTTVVAVDGGVVVAVSSNSCPDTGDSANKRNCGGQLGNWIDIQHSNGTITRYGHLQQGSIKVKKGQKLSKGQKIGGVGSSGWSTGSHLDIRVHDGKGNYRDPRPYLGI